MSTDSKKAAVPAVEGDDSAGKQPATTSPSSPNVQDAETIGLPLPLLPEAAAADSIVQNGSPVGELRAGKPRRISPESLASSLKKPPSRVR